MDAWFVQLENIFQLKNVNSNYILPFMCDFTAVVGSYRL